MCYNVYTPVCSCNSSKFCYQPAGHVITGDLDIVENKTLRELLSTGPKFREPISFSWKQNLETIMNSVEDYAKRWAKEEDVEVDTSSEWVKSIASLVNRRIQSNLRTTMSTRCKSMFNIPAVVDELADIHDKYAIVPADKASNNIVFVCKAHYINCLREELCLNSTAGSR